MKIVTILLISIVFSGCIGCRAYRRSSLEGTYDLQARDDAGNLVFEGTISLTSVSGEEVRGDCKVVKVTESFGFSKDPGRCEGTRSGDKIFLDLAPGVDDAGVDLEGVWRDGHIEGTWRVRSFAGATLGKFKALRR